MSSLRLQADLHVLLNMHGVLRPPDQVRITCTYLSGQVATELDLALNRSVSELDALVKRNLGHPNFQVACVFPDNRTLANLPKHLSLSEAFRDLIAPPSYLPSSTDRDVPGACYPCVLWLFFGQLVVCF